MINKKNQISSFALVFLIFLLITIYSPTVRAPATFEENTTGVADCGEQLQLCIGEFNSLLSDFWNGTNCDSETFTYLKQKNSDLAIDRSRCMAQVEELKGELILYKIGFLALVIVLCLISVIFYSKNKSRRRLRNGNKKRKKENR